MKEIYQAKCINCNHKFYLEVCCINLDEKKYCPVCGGGVEVEDCSQNKNKNKNICAMCKKK